MELVDKKSKESIGDIKIPKLSPVLAGDLIEYNDKIYRVIDRLHAEKEGKTAAKRLTTKLIVSEV